MDIKTSALQANKTKNHFRRSGFSGGDGEDRTLDLLNAIQALSQLSYAPITVARLYYHTFDENARPKLKLI